MRRGFTMVEVMMGLVLTLMVGGVVYQVLNNSQRVSRAQMAQTGMQDNVRSGSLVIANELRELGYDSIPTSLGLVGSLNIVNPDLILAEPGRIRYKATRGTGFTCAVPTTTQLKLKKTTFYGVRTPVLGDSVAVYVEGTATTAGDDAWVHGKVTAAVTTGTCVDGSEAWVLPMTYPAAYINLGTVFNTLYIQGGPVRILEPMEMRYYSSGGKMWLGMRAYPDGIMEPVIGPLSDSTVTRGLTFNYRDFNDQATVVPNLVRRVTVTLNGITDEAVRQSNGLHAVIDTLQLSSGVALRNTLRP